MYEPDNNDIHVWHNIKLRKSVYMFRENLNLPCLICLPLTTLEMDPDVYSTSIANILGTYSLDRCQRLILSTARRKNIYYSHQSGGCRQNESSEESIRSAQSTEKRVSGKKCIHALYLHSSIFIYLHFPSVNWRSKLFPHLLLIAPITPHFEISFVLASKSRVCGHKFSSSVELHV